ncbi:PREDICTED: uncharacterized protein LOC109580171 [Amphimedon queenslandica]|uniref:Uncharacterized protein n=1 Tax=Amphimedon queenslandica TaxID=400682 RepID=A0AAN0IV59_AMPQE|nr:PREDICTED: uncharacterized protein LOC109580171 [Amphimedon queenslandica]|eukprot:XP_019848624.1 PREDICTED: uncharacterized protein LOC109580171 [Amphimedon queenslandica]
MTTFITPFERYMFNQLPVGQKVDKDVVSHDIKDQSDLQYPKTNKQKTKPLRELLSKKSQWYWGPEQEHVFSELKNGLRSTGTPALFDPERETRVSAEAESHRLAAIPGPPATAGGPGWSAGAGGGCRQGIAGGGAPPAKGIARGSGGDGGSGSSGGGVGGPPSPANGGGGGPPAKGIAGGGWWR